MLTDLCQALPFLRQLPQSVLRLLDTSPRCLPTGAAARVRVELEEEFNCSVMTYRDILAGDSAAERLHLCRLLAPAHLTSAQLVRLRRAETIFENEGIIFVAYGKQVL